MIENVIDYTTGYAKFKYLMLRVWWSKNSDQNCVYSWYARGNFKNLHQSPWLTF